ncbi:MAG: hypothetical protein MHM6MM_005443, partial [Cercozoa sp. M6MM]
MIAQIESDLSSSLITKRRAAMEQVATLFGRPSVQLNRLVGNSRALDTSGTTAARLVTLLAAQVNQESSKIGKTKNAADKTSDAVHTLADSCRSAEAHGHLLGDAAEQVCRVCADALRRNELLPCHQVALRALCSMTQQYMSRLSTKFVDQLFQHTVRYIERLLDAECTETQRKCLGMAGTLLSNFLRHSPCLSATRLVRWCMHMRPLFLPIYSQEKNAAETQTRMHMLTTLFPGVTFVLRHLTMPSENQGAPIRVCSSAFITGGLEALKDMIRGTRLARRRVSFKPLFALMRAHLDTLGIGADTAAWVDSLRVLRLTLKRSSQLSLSAVAIREVLSLICT